MYVVIYFEWERGEGERKREMMRIFICIYIAHAATRDFKRFPKKQLFGDVNISWLNFPGETFPFVVLIAVTSCSRTKEKSFVVSGNKLSRISPTSAVFLL